MARLLAVAKTKIFVGRALAYDGVDLTAADFTGGSPTWTEIGGTTSLGSAGDTAEVIDSTHIGDGRLRRVKGTRSGGELTIVCDADFTDAGQIALLAAERADTSFAFKIVFNDAPSGGTGSTRYFTGLVSSASEEVAEANSTIKLNATVLIDSNIVRVAAAEA